MAKQKLAGAGDWGLRGALLQMFHPLLVESVPQVGNLHPMTPGSVIVASAGSWSQLPHTDVATHPGVLPPKDGDISRCHLSSFLCLSEEYQVQVKAGTALGEAGEVRWDTIQLQRGDMLLMEATNRHHGMPALLDAKDGLQGALFNLWTPTAKYRHHQPNTTHLDPPPPREAHCVLYSLCWNVKPWIILRAADFMCICMRLLLSLRCFRRSFGTGTGGHGDRDSIVPGIIQLYHFIGIQQQVV